MECADRIRRLPRLGLGVSTEWGAGDADGALDLVRLRTEHPEYAGFLEVGVEAAKGLDRHALDWVAAGGAATYHFLDVNLDEPEDLEEGWIADVVGAARRLKAEWLCGDAGLWHFGPRDRGQMLLLPPVLTRASAAALGAGVRTLRIATGMEVLPENPPGTAYLGDLHLCEFLAALAEEGDCPLLLDVAHFAIYQEATGRGGMDALPWDRIVEVHVAGGVPRESRGFRWIDDDHSPEPLPETWALLEHLLPRAPNLRAVVFECERNPLERCLPTFARIRSMLA